MTNTRRTFDGFDVTEHADGRVVWTAGKHAGQPGVDAYCKDMTRVATKFRAGHWSYRNG